MATNKHAVIRYQTLDKCFRNPGKKYFIEDLVLECNNAIYEFSGSYDGVKRRQLYEDIKFMESEQGWSVQLNRYKVGKKVYLRYNDLTFSINSSPLNQSEQVLLKEALFTLTRFKGMPQFEWIEEIFTRMDRVLGLNSQKTSTQVIEFEQNSYVKGLEFITPVYNSISNKVCLEITYKPFNKQEEKTLIISPYYLKQYNGRWFLFGKSTSFDSVTNLPLDRIAKFKECSEEYFENNIIDFSEYFEDAIGVTVKSGDVPEKIVLEVNNSLVSYIKTKPLHGSQKVLSSTAESTIVELSHGEDGTDGAGVESAESTIVELSLIINYELISLLLSHGDSIRIIEPDSLRLALLAKSKGMVNNYS